MSSEQLSSDAPEPRHQGPEPAPPGKRSGPPENDSRAMADSGRRRRSSPAVRLAAWMLAAVLVLLVFAWALRGVL